MKKICIWWLVFWVIFGNTIPVYAQTEYMTSNESTENNIDGKKGESEEKRTTEDSKDTGEYDTTEKPAEPEDKSGSKSQDDEEEKSNSKGGDKSGEKTDSESKEVEEENREQSKSEVLSENPELVDAVVVDEQYSAYAQPGASVVVNSGSEFESAVSDRIPNIYMGRDIDISILLHPVEIRHTCTVFGQGHKLYGTGGSQSQLVMRGGGQVLNLCNIIYDEHSQIDGGSIIREYEGTVNVYDCTVLNGMHGVEIDGGTINLYNFNVHSTHQGIAITGREKTATANVYGNTSFSQTKTSKTEANVAGISIERHSTNYVNLYTPVSISGYTNAVYNTGIINNIPQGSKLDSKNCGIYNTGTIKAMAGSVYSNTTGILNNGNIASCSGQIYSNTTGILNYGTIEISGGNIYSNSVGLDNSGTANHKGGNIKTNSKYGVLQRGTYRMSATARVPVSANYSVAGSISNENNTVYLAFEKGVRHVIEVDGAFSGLGANSAPVAVIDSGSKGVGAGGDRYVGRAAVVVKTTDASTYAQRIMPYFALKFSDNYIDDGIKGWYTNHWRDATTGREQNWVRAGNGVIGSKGTLYYSIRLKAKYKNGFSGREVGIDGFSTEAVDSNGNAIRPSVSVPPDEEYWRGEDTALQGLSNRIKCYISLPDEDGKDYRYDLNTSLSNTGFKCDLTSKDGSKYSKSLQGGESIPGKYLMSPAAFDAVWNVTADIVYDGNDQTNEQESPDYFKEANPLDSPLDDNMGPLQNVVDDFGRPSYFQKETENERYSFAGWSYKIDSIYTDEGIIKPGGGLISDGDDALDYIFGLISGFSNIKDINPAGNEGSVGVRLFAVWDAYPKINAPDRAFTLSDYTGGKITDEELKRKIIITDKEDDDGSVKPVISYDITGLDGVDENNPIKSISVSVEVTDGFGNKTATTFKVNVCFDLAPSSQGKENGEPDKGASPVYIRFIDKDNYGLGLTSHTDTGTDYKAAREACENGACEPDSVWYVQEDYKGVIESAFGALDSKKYEESFEFGYEDIKSINAYTQSDGINRIDDATKWHETLYNRYIKPNIM